MREHQTNPNQGALYKTPDQYSSKAARSWKKEKTEKQLQIDWKRLRR